MGEVGNPQGPDAWFRGLPVITRYWFGATLVVTLAVNFKLMQIYHVVWTWDSFVSKLELWRSLTCFLYIGKFEFNTLISLMLLVQFSERYEKGGPFNTGAGGGTADYCFMLMIMMVLTLLTYPLGLMISPLPPIFARNLIYGVLYIWSKRNPSGQANIWGIPIPSMYLPFAYIAFTVFLGGSYMDMLHGMAVGHFYYFLAEVVPQVQGRDILKTPQFLIDQFGIGEYHPGTMQQQQQAPPIRTTTFAGTGQRLGGGGGGGGGGPTDASSRPSTSTSSTLNRSSSNSSNNNNGQRPTSTTASTSSGGYNWGSSGRPLGRE